MLELCVVRRGWAIYDRWRVTREKSEPARLQARRAISTTTAARGNRQQPFDARNRDRRVAAAAGVKSGARAHRN